MSASSRFTSQSDPERGSYEGPGASRLPPRTASTIRDRFGSQAFAPRLDQVVPARFDGGEVSTPMQGGRAATGIEVSLPLTALLSSPTAGMPTSYSLLDGSSPAVRSRHGAWMSASRAVSAVPMHTLDSTSYTQDWAAAASHINPRPVRTRLAPGETQRYDLSVVVERATKATFADTPGARLAAKAK